MKKRFVLFLLIICLCFSLAIPSYALTATNEKQSYITEETLMEYTIEQNSGVQVTPVKSYPVYDVSGNPTYVCVEFIHSNISGFGLIDLVNFTVVMYTLDGNPFFTSEDTVLYNGVMDFAIINQNSNTAIICGNNEQVATSTLMNDSRAGLTVMPSLDREQCLNSFVSSFMTTQSRAVEDVLIPGGDDESLVYSSGNYSGDISTDCGLNAAAIYLRHMDEYVLDVYVPSTQNTQEKLKIALAEIAQTTVGSTTSLSMSNIAKSINAYIDEYSGSSAVDVSNSSYSWTKYKNRIADEKPCILYIGAGDTEYWEKAHAVVGVGYTGGSTSSSGYLIVNSGFQSYKYVNILTTIPGYIIK